MHFYHLSRRVSCRHLTPREGAAEGPTLFFLGSLHRTFLQLLLFCCHLDGVLLVDLDVLQSGIDRDDAEEGKDGDSDASDFCYIQLVAVIPVSSRAKVPRSHSCCGSKRGRGDSCGG